MCKLIVFLVVLCTFTSVLGRSTSGHWAQSLGGSDKPEQTKQSSNRSESTQTLNNGPNTLGFISELSALYKMYQQCSTKDTSVCLKVKLITVLDNAANSIKNVSILEGINFIQDPTEEYKNTKKYPISEMEIEASLPRSLHQKETTLNGMIFDKIFSFLRSHTLQIKFPSAEEMARSMDESRDKKKKKKDNGAFIMIPLLLGGTFIPIAYGALALLAGKALIVSKLALVLASIIGIKKLLGSSGGKEAQHEVVVSNGHNSGWGRDIDLAYSAYAPKDRSKNIQPF